MIPTEILLSTEEVIIRLKKIVSTFQTVFQVGIQCMLHAGSGARMSIYVLAISLPHRELLSGTS